MPEAPIRGRIHLPPVETARAFDARRELRQTVRWSEMFHGDHARAFTVAKIARLDLLEEIRASLERVLSEGGTLEQWQRDIVPTLQRAGWWGTVRDRDLTGTSRAIVVGPRRLRTIFDTNLRVSRAAGQWQRIQDRKDVAPYLRYSAIMDSRTRPLHRAWHGVILPVDHRFWQDHFPPNGWNCRCTIIQLSKSQLDANGWKLTTDVDLARIAALHGGDRPRPFRRAGGEIVQVPRGIDPGFAYNPGAASFLAIAAKAAQTLANLARRDPIAAIGQLVDLARGAPAMRIVHSLGQAGEESADAVRGFARQLSTDEVRHAFAYHGLGSDDLLPVEAADFGLIPRVIAEGRRVDTQKGHLANQIFVALIDGIYFVYVERIGRHAKRLLARTFYKARHLPMNLREEGR